MSAAATFAITVSGLAGAGLSQWVAWLAVTKHNGKRYPWAERNLDPEIHLSRVVGSFVLAAVAGFLVGGMLAAFAIGVVRGLAGAVS